MIQNKKWTIAIVYNQNMKEAKRKLEEVERTAMGGSSYNDKEEEEELRSR